MRVSTAWRIGSVRPKIGKRSPMNGAALSRSAAAALVEREERRTGSRMAAYQNVAATVGASAEWIRKYVRGEGEVMLRRGELKGIISQEQIETIDRLYRGNASNLEMAAATGLDPNQVSHRIAFEIRSGLREKRARVKLSESQRNIRRRQTELKRRQREWEGFEALQRLNLQLGNGARPTPDILRERDRRLALPHRDLTGAFFGDPRVGLSALDRVTA